MRGSDKTLVVQILAVAMWESNPADALFGAAGYYPAGPRGSRSMLTQCNHLVLTGFFSLGGTFVLHANMRRRDD